MYCFLRHTHDLVDQVFSRISARLSKVNCCTVETFAAVVAEAYSPTPSVEQLNGTIDFQAWLGPHFFQHVDGITEPHQFHITRTTDLENFPTGTCIRAQLYSDTPPNKPWSILKSMPEGIPYVKAGRPLFYRHKDGTEAEFAADFENFRKQIEKINMLPHQRVSWNNVISDLEQDQSRPKYRYNCWWPESKEEVIDLLESFEYEPSSEGMNQKHYLNVHYS